MKDDAHYFTYKDETTVNIGRIYDFKITDCSDVDFKMYLEEQVQEMQ